MRNIDTLIASLVYEQLKNPNIKYKKLENLVNKTIAILLESGLFSAVLFVDYQQRKNNKEEGKFLLELISKLIKENKELLLSSSHIQEKNENTYEFIILSLKEITKDVYLTMFTSNLIYEALVYLRYSIKGKK